MRALLEIVEVATVLVAESEMDAAHRFGLGSGYPDALRSGDDAPYETPPKPDRALAG